MPLPAPHDNEMREAFITRCMGDAVMSREYPQVDQRTAVCNSIWRRRELSSNPEALDGWMLFVASNEPFYALATPTVADGIEQQLFSKDLIRVGKYTHPVHGWTLDVTRERIDGWVRAFSAMRADGIDVEVLSGHVRGSTADPIRGYVIDMHRKDDTLVAVHQMRGEGIALAKTVRNVSPGIDKDYVGSSGKHYGEAIVHSAIVQKPLVGGQQEFVPIAASMEVDDNRKQRGAYFLAATSKEQTMDIKELLAKLAKVIGLSEGQVTVENAIPQLQEKWKALSAAAESKDESEELKKVRGELTVATNQIEAFRASGATPVKADADAVGMMADASRQRLSQLVESGKISKEAGDDLATALVGTEENPKVLFLSRAVSGGTPIARQVIDALDKNKVIDLDGRTGPQHMSLSRTVPDGEKDEEVDKATQDEMVESAGGAEKKAG